MVVGCSNTSDENEAKNDKKVLVYGSDDYNAINPALYEHEEIDSLIFSGLTAHGEYNEIEPCLAKDWEYDKGYDTYTFKLRNDVVWHDGEKFTADDVKFTLDTIMDPKNNSKIASNFEDIRSVEVLADDEIRIKLNSTNTAILDYLTVGILPKHILDGKDISKDEFNQNPVGTGPFKLSKWEKGKSITLEKNLEYFEITPILEKVVFKIVPDDKDKAAGLKNGELDIAKIAPKDAVLFKDQKGFKMNVMKTAEYSAVMYNFNSGFFSEDVSSGVPNALSYGVDREGILKNVLKGYGEVAYSPIQKGDYNNPEIEKFEYDPEKAKRKIERLGWRTGEDGIYEKDDKKLSFDIVYEKGDSIKDEIAKAVAKGFKDIGVDAKAVAKDKVNYSKDDSTLVGWGSPFDPDDSTYKFFVTDKEFNLNGFSSKRVDKTLQKARETDDEEKKLDRYMRFQDELTWDSPYTFITYTDAIYVVKDNIEGFTTGKLLGYNGVGIFTNIAEWVIK